MEQDKIIEELNKKIDRIYLRIHNILKYYKEFNQEEWVRILKEEETKIKESVKTLNQVEKIMKLFEKNAKNMMKWEKEK